MTRKPNHRFAGFTLIEVLVAMFVIAIGIGALLNVLGGAASSVGRQREKSFAEWVALNRISEARLETAPPSTGVTSGETEFAGTKWRWRQEVIDPEIAGILRIEVAVALASASSSSKTESADDFPSITKAYGFLGKSVSSPNGLDPAWVLPRPRNPEKP